MSKPTAKRDAILLEIAKRDLDVETLETRNMDGLDFKEQSAASLKRALEAAYEAGFKAGYAKASVDCY